MIALGINGSPRKRWNTATLLEHALAGTASMGLETEIVHLYDHRYQGCKSCFACKRIGGRSYGRCAVKDGLTPILEKVAGCDVLILGSPLYWHTETGAMRSFVERLFFPYMTYTPGYGTITPKSIQTALIYTMNVSRKDLPAHPQFTMIRASKKTMTFIFGNCELFLCTDTYQFDDYSKYVSTVWDAEAKARRHREVFPRDCRRAFKLGVKLATKAQSRESQSEEPEA